MNGALTLQAISIAIAQRRLVENISISIAAGEIVTLMGPSGSGKSTLLDFIGGHLDPCFVASGRVLLGGDDVTAWPPERRGIGVLFQDDLLFPHLSVAGNLAFGLPRAIKGKGTRHSLVMQALAEAGLPGFASRDPATLSGGQRARVALLRTLLSQPRALLLDEPFGKLDQVLRQEIRRFVFSHATSRALPVFLVTHDSADAEAAGGRVLTIS